MLNRMLLISEKVHTQTETFQVVCTCGTCIRDSQKQPLEVSMKKGVLKNFANFTGKHLCRSLLLRVYF